MRLKIPTHMTTMKSFLVVDDRTNKVTSRILALSLTQAAQEFQVDNAHETLIEDPCDVPTYIQPEALQHDLCAILYFIKQKTGLSNKHPIVTKWLSRINRYRNMFVDWEVL